MPLRPLRINSIINLLRPTVYFGVAVLLIGLLILIAKSPLFEMNPNVLSLVITLDLLISIPLIYYFLIRKTKIPKTSVSSIIVLGLVVGIFIIPIGNQQYLNLFRIWLLPAVEISVILFIVYEVRKKMQKKPGGDEAALDFFTALKSTCYRIIPKPLAVPLATEISVLYYGLFYWKKRVKKTNEFSYHKNNAIISTLVAVIFILAIETLAFHILLMDMSNKAAWILTFCSLYTIIQVLGFLRSIIKRPISIEKNTLNLRFGILRETHINLCDIESFEITTKQIEFNREARRFSPLGEYDGHNVILTLNQMNVYSGFYGLKRKFKTIAFYIDNKEEFKIQLENALQQHV